MTDAETLPIDHEKLAAHRHKTTLPGAYLEVWHTVETYLMEKGVPIKLDEYLVTFSENDDLFIVEFERPMNRPVLGGGSGTCKVDKKAGHVIACRFGK